MCCLKVLCLYWQSSSPHPFSEILGAEYSRLWQDLFLQEQVKQVHLPELTMQQYLQHQARIVTILEMLEMYHRFLLYPCSFRKLYTDHKQKTLTLQFPVFWLPSLQNRLL